MNLNEAYFLGVAILLILCVLASKASARLGIPTLVVFLAIGMLAGSEGLGQIEFNDTRNTQSMGIIALAYILFSGGLDTKWAAIRPIMKEGVILSTFRSSFYVSSFRYIWLLHPRFFTLRKLPFGCHCLLY